MRGEVMDKITAVGLDLAKQIIQVHGIDAAGRVVLRKAVRRERLLALLAQLPRVVVGMEACSGTHHWARDRKSTRLNSSHEWISYAVFCLKKKKNKCES